MNRFLTLLFAASCLNAVGQNMNYIFDSQLEDQGWELLLERQGQQYWLLNQDYTWEESMAICTSLGGYLYWPNSSAEHFDVWSQVEHGVDSVQYWTGIHQDFELVDCNSGGGWVGPDGTPQQYFDWYPGEPSNYNGGESVVQFEWGPVGIQWNDAPGQQCDSLNQDPYNIRESRIIMERSKDAGCTDSTAWNYDETATIDDGSCLLGSSFCGPGTIWDAALQMCIGDGSGDINLDGCVQLNDLLDLLSAYGFCGAEESAWQCGDPFEYQGYDYETVQIGEQCWFAENLKKLDFVFPGNDDKSISEPRAYVQGYNGYDVEEAILSDNFHEYGVLYNYPAVLNESLCPSGWSPGTDQDWIDLVVTLGVDSVEANTYTCCNGEEYRGDVADLLKDESWQGGINTSGFSALPAGFVRANGGESFDHLGTNGYFWTTSEAVEEYLSQGMLEETAMIHYLFTGVSGVGRIVTNRAQAFSVRCLKDSE